MKSYLDYYLAQIKLAILGQFQYRVGVMLWLMSLVFEPIVSLVVWQTIARANGGSVSGYTAGDFAAYYIGWTLVRHMNITLTPFEIGRAHV